jgi:polyhydroxybutyrate depolymerase
VKAQDLRFCYFNEGHFFVSLKGDTDQMKFVNFIFCFAFIQAGAQDIAKQISIDGVKREYIVHLPPNFTSQKKLPLVLVFHGGGGTAQNSIQFYGMNAIADTANFIVVYPNGIKKGWNDGREVKKHSQDDIGFIRQLLQRLSQDYPVDEQRIFSTGISNGGFFSFTLALRLPDKFRAIAPVCATIAKDIFDTYRPSKPISLLLINGTEDPLVPYEGGKVGGKLMSRGQCAGTSETIARFLQINQCKSNATQSPMPNADVNDGCTATRFVYSCDNGQAVQQIKINGGGHTWPGGKHYLGKRLVGRTCRDFSATIEVWNFFRKF